MKNLTHIDDKGKASMVDISLKPVSLRTARAEGFIKLGKATISLINQNQIKKGDVLTLAETAGIMGGKKTSGLIPLCHPINITKIDVKASVTDQGVKVVSEAACTGQTGIEMEALTTVSIALLTVYDMCKAVDKNMTIEYIRLLEKTKKEIK